MDTVRGWGGAALYGPRTMFTQYRGLRGKQKEYGEKNFVAWWLSLRKVRCVHVYDAPDWT